MEKEDRIQAALPYFFRRRLGLRLITLPPLTQNLMLWTRCPNTQQQHKRLSFEKAVISELISQFPAYDYCELGLYHSLTNWLPFYWHGFKQSTNYTYVIENLDMGDEVFARFSHAKRKNLKRAEAIVQLGPELNAGEFYAHSCDDFGQGGAIG